MARRAPMFRAERHPGAKQRLADAQRHRSESHIYAELERLYGEELNDDEMGDPDRGGHYALYRGAQVKGRAKPVFAIMETKSGGRIHITEAASDAEILRAWKKLRGRVGYSAAADERSYGDSYSDDPAERLRFLRGNPRRAPGSQPDARVVRLAGIFSEIIRHDLTPAQLAEVRKRNAARGDSTCATHDFIDSNEVMLTAFKRSEGRDADLQSDADGALIDAAWTLAKRAGFAPSMAELTRVPRRNPSSADDPVAFLLGRASYEGGRFLDSSIALMSKADRDAIERRIVDEKHPLAFQPGTQQARIAAWIRDKARGVSGNPPGRVRQVTFREGGGSGYGKAQRAAFALRTEGFSAEQGSIPSAAGSWADTIYIMTDAPMPAVRRIAKAEGLTVQGR